MTDDSRPISLEVQADGGTVSSAEALSVGVIVTELVINAFKHAFVGDAAAGVLVIAYEAAETSWRLTVSDNGIGMPEGQLDSDKPRPGLGTIIVAALAKQLDAHVEVMGSRRGTTVSITHGTPDRACLPLAGADTGLSPKSNGKTVAAASMRPTSHPGQKIGLAFNSLLRGQEQTRQPFECLAAVLDL